MPIRVWQVIENGAEMGFERHDLGPRDLGRALMIA